MSVSPAANRDFSILIFLRVFEDSDLVISGHFFTENMQTAAAESRCGNFLPKFLDLPEEYKCVQCKEALRGPLQTQCGHRICNSCFSGMLMKTGRVMCPGGEEVCVEITLKSVNRDMGAKREIKQFQVYCMYEKYGCPDVMCWKDLEEHVTRCRFAPGAGLEMNGKCMCLIA